jgi:hypothetical protein
MELMVVVAILSLLASMVVPTIRLVFNFANNSVCAANLGELYRGMLLYEADHGKFNMWHKNFNEYSRSHHIYESIWQGHHNGLRPLGYQGLGTLVGSNPVWTGRNWLTSSPEWDKSPQAHINRFKSGSGGEPPKKHMKYVGLPNVFYCPSMELGYHQYLQWDEPWSYWPHTRGPGETKYRGYVYATYAMRPGTRRDWGIPGDRGMALSGESWRGNIWPGREYGLTTPGNAFEGEAVISDCMSLKVYVPNCHQTGLNVIYRNKSVHYYEDKEGYLTTYSNTTFSEGFREAGAKNIVRAWADYDTRFNP